MKTPPFVRLARIVIACALVLSLGFLTNTPAQAGGGGIMVTTLTDGNDTNLSDGICNSGGGWCSLRAAIQESNHQVGPQSIYFQWTPGVDGVQTYPLTLGQIDISDSVEINGNGIYTVIDANQQSRIFSIPAGTPMVTIRNAKFLRGKVTDQNGGAINSNANLTLDGCIFEQNQAAGDGKGGVLFNTGPLLIRDSRFKNNQANMGGAIFHTAGSNANSINMVMNSTFENNAAIGGAGGAVVIYTHLNFDGVMFRQNQDLYGGGALRFQDAGTVSNSTFFQNSSQSGGGAISVTTNKPVIITNSTFYQNASVSQGGAISITDTSPNVRMYSLTVVENQASSGALFAGSSAALVNSVFARNTDSLSQPSSCKLQNTAVHFTPSAGNLSDDATCAFSGQGDQNNVTVKLGPLLNNGGPVPTMALLPGSAAIDAAAGDLCPFTDARGIRRLADGRCDSGTYEHHVSTPPLECKPTDHTFTQILRDPIAIAPGASHTATINVSLASPTAAIWDVNVLTGIETPKSENLRMTLTAPDGTWALLTDGNGASGGIQGVANLFRGTLWDDLALAPVAAQPNYIDNVPATLLSPQTPLGRMLWKNPTGSWTLTIQNKGAAKDLDFILTNWHLRMTTCEGQPTQDPGGATFLWTGSELVPDLGEKTVTIQVPVDAFSRSRKIARVSVVTSVSHAWTSDLSVWLTSPAGTTVPLTLRNGAGLDDLYNNTTWTTFATFSPVEYPYVNGNPVPQIAPQVSFSAFAGERPGGAWTLTLRDAQAGYPGTITRFGISFVTVADYQLQLPMLTK